MKPLCLDRLPSDISPRIEFEYPNDEPENEQQKKMNEFVLRLLIQTLHSKAPKTYLMGLCYVYGINLEQVLGDNRYTSMESIAEYLGIKKQSFYDVVVRIRKKKSMFHLKEFSVD